jgi:hypothetical protein
MLAGLKTRKIRLEDQVCAVANEGARIRATADGQKAADHSASALFEQFFFSSLPITSEGSCATVHLQSLHVRVPGCIGNFNKTTHLFCRCPR